MDSKNRENCGVLLYWRKQIPPEIGCHRIDSMIVADINLEKLERNNVRIQYGKQS